MDAALADLQAHVASIFSVRSERYADWDAIEDRSKVNQMIDRLGKICFISWAGRNSLGRLRLPNVGRTATLTPVRVSARRGIYRQSSKTGL